MRLRSGQRRLGLAFAVLLAVGGAARAEYRLGASDTVRIKLQEWPELAGEYTVNPAGDLSLPLIGETRAAGLSVGELVALVSDRLRLRTGAAERPVVAAEIVRFRPVFILGDVQRPGDHAWRPNLTVLQAVALAGGFQRPPNPAGLRLDRDLALAQGELQSLAQRRDRLAVRSARLEAAIEGRRDFAAPQPSGNAGPEFEALVAGERALLASERERAAAELRSLETIRAIYRDQITFMTGQVEALRRETEPLRRQLGELRGLSGRGLAVTPTLMALERALAQNENEQLGISAAVARARESIENADQRARDIAAERQREQRRELQSVRQEAAEVEGRIATALELVDEVYATAETESRLLATEATRRREVVVVRRVDGALRELPADDGMALLPEDVVRVSPLPRRPNFRLQPPPARAELPAPSR